ncbi:MAG TPA: site-2 protease family protein [Methylomirabilota bacterium]|jgi:Zn-dependent protease|nr:site-2 protease family protein [Methylomirabilota bacterium]
MTSNIQVAPGVRVPFRRAVTWRLAVLGVPVTIDISWPLALGLAAWTLADAVLPLAAPGRPLASYVLAGITGAALGLLSLALHEFGHCVAARRAGLGVARVTLSLVGGTCQLSEAPRRPSTELRIAAAGPVVTAGCALTAAVTHVVLVEHDADPLTSALAAALAVGNVLFLLLNVLPGLPLDGGRIARAALWAITGREPLATRVTLAAGRIMAMTLLTLAVIASASGDAAAAVWSGFLGVILLPHPD